MLSGCLVLIISEGDEYKQADEGMEYSTDGVEETSDLAVALEFS